MREFSLAECGLETVAQACARRGWARKTLQNWVARDLLAVAVVGGGRSVYLLRIADVDAFVPPVREDRRGRPLVPKLGKPPEPKSKPKKGGRP